MAQTWWEVGGSCPVHRGGSQAAKGKLESLCHTDSPQEAFRALPTENAKCGSIGELVKKHIIYLSVLFIKLWA